MISQGLSKTTTRILVVVLVFNKGKQNFNQNSKEKLSVPGDDQFFIMEVEFKDIILGANQEITFLHHK